MYTLNMDIPVERFTDWLSAFNKWLAYTGDTDKDKHHYRLHLRNWLNQHNLNREDPKQYSPVGQQSFSKPVVRSTGEMPKKTAQQIIAENAAYEEELIRKLKAM
jgi:hypothetical protein